MKKRLEAELISIAHRILKLKNKSEVDQLYVETRKLYEILSVLKFYGDQYEMVKNDISLDDLETKLTEVLEAPAAEKEVVVQAIETPKETEIVEEEITIEETPLETQEEEITEETQEEKAEDNNTPIIVGEITIEEEEENEIPEEQSAEAAMDFEPIFELMAEAPIEEIKEEPKETAKQISFEDLLGGDYTEPVFVKPNDVVKITPKVEETVEESIPTISEITEIATVVTPAKETEIETPKVEKTSILNEKLGSGINIGLNDRVGFVKYLFGDSSEDFNRVLSQLNTFDTYRDAKDFIDTLVKPDYNNWKGQEDYEERFMEIVERKFQ